MDHFHKKNLPCSRQGVAFQGSHKTLVFLNQHRVLFDLYSVSDLECMSDAECPFMGLHF